MFTFSLYKYGEKKLWGRDKGKRIKEQILEYFYSSKKDILQLDFNGIDVVDFSFASEVVAVLISRLSGEMSGKHIILSNVRPLVKENVSIALEKADLCAMVLKERKKIVLIGKISQPLEETFNAVVKYESIDTPKLAELLETSVHSVNNRLKILISFGLIKRTQITAPSGGKQYIYYSII